MPIIRIQSTSESIPPKSFEYFKISCFALTLFFVVTDAPWERPICLLFLLAVSIPSFVFWCKSETSFSDCSKDNDLFLSKLHQILVDSFQNNICLCFCQLNVVWQGFFSLLWRNMQIYPDDPSVSIDKTRKNGTLDTENISDIDNIQKMEVEYEELSRK